MKTLRLFIILFVISANCSFAQSYYKGLTLNSHKVTINYPDHNITVFIKPVKGEVFPEGDKLYYWYSANQIKVTQGGFSGSLLNGAYSEYYLNRNLKEKGEFKNGLKTGLWSSWKEEGILKEQITWYSGKRNGPYSKYDSVGRLVEKGIYRKDKLHGKLTKYTEAGNTEASYYRDGQLSSEKKGFWSFITNPFKTGNEN
jgi:antitoxin component YwqK of YwqJK toxin-antitoxin module